MSLKLSERTLQLLQNFEGICPSVVLQSGKVLRTINDSSTVIAIAQIEEDFPFEFPIMDMGKLLSILRLPNFKACELDFTADMITIRGSNAEVNFWRSAKELAAVPPDELTTDTVVFQATITAEQMKEFTRACSALGHKTARLVNKGGKAMMVGVTTTLDNSNNYTLHLGETALGDCCVNLDVGNLKFVESEYTVSADNDQQIVHFQAKDATLNYFVGMQLE